MCKLRCLAGSLALAAGPALAQPVDPPVLERVQITGSAVRRIAGETALPVLILDRQQIERSGATSLTDLLQQLPAAQNMTNEATAVGGGSVGFAGVSLHNLGETRTLVLLNGRRLAPFAGQTLSGDLAGVDLNTLPLWAVERVEVLADGASALYGADAIGGVINVVTRRGGSEGGLGVGLSAPHAGALEKRLSLSKGFGRLDEDGFNFSLGANIDRRSALRSVDRGFARSGVVDFTLRGRRVVFFNGSPRSIPGNVTHDAGTPDDGSDDFLASPFLAANGRCPPKHVALDVACYYDFVQDVEIYPERERAAALAQLDVKLGGGHTLFTELLASNTHNTNRLAPTPGDISVGPDSPFWAGVLGVNPAATVPAVVLYRASDLGPRETRDETRARHAVVGVQGPAAGWEYEASLTHSVNRQRSILGGGWVRLDGFLQALGSGLVDPFVLPDRQSPQALQALREAQILGFWEGGRSTLNSLQLRGSRDMVRLPGGPLALALGASHMRESFRKLASPLAQGLGDSRFGDGAAIVPYSAGRHSSAVFAEAVAPLTRAWELTAALRHDRYSDFGGATTAKLAARWQPAASWLLRASLGTGFKAPTVPQLKAPLQDYGRTGGSYGCGPALQQLAGELGAVCPAGEVQYNVRAGGNADLQPERSRQWTLGVRAEPAAWLSLGADLWQVQLKDQIGQIDESTVFGDPLKWRSQFTTVTDPGTGQKLLALLSDNRNLGRNTQRGIDVDARARWATPVGRLSTRLSLSYWLLDRYQFEPSGESFSSLGRFGPDGRVTFRWQGRLAGTLEAGALAHTLGLNIRSGYRDQRYTAADFAVFDPVSFESFDYEGRVARHVTVDWQTRWTPDPSITLSAGVLNLLDRDPPRSLKSAGGPMIGYDERYYDPRGRTLYATLAFAFR